MDSVDSNYDELWLTFNSLLLFKRRVQSFLSKACQCTSRVRQATMRNSIVVTEAPCSSERVSAWNIKHSRIHQNSNRLRVLHDNISPPPLNRALTSQKKLKLKRGFQKITHIHYYYKTFYFQIVNSLLLRS